MLSHLNDVIQWKVVMAFMTGMVTAGILLYLLPAAAVSATSCPGENHTNGLMNILIENKILPG
jgi:hypothetical protein